MNKKVFVTSVIILFIGLAFAPSINSQTAREQNFENGMRIDFFERFPTEDNLRKTELINFPSTIYIAADSLDQFKKFENTLFEINPEVDTGYWPILEKSNWVSPFSYTYELENLIDDLQKNQQNKTLKVILDLELPLLNMKLFIINLFSFFKNKRLIEQLFEKADEFNIEILTAEWIRSDKLLELLGISYPLEKYPHKKIAMFYSSIYSFNFIYETAKIRVIHKLDKYGENLQVALGLIARGLAGTIPVIPPETLDRDLSFLEDNGIKTAVIFRLGGLNESYLNVIKKYL